MNCFTQILGYLVILSNLLLILAILFHRFYKSKAEIESFNDAKRRMEELKRMIEEREV